MTIAMPPNVATAIEKIKVLCSNGKDAIGVADRSSGNLSLWPGVNDGHASWNTFDAILEVVNALSEGFPRIQEKRS